VPAGTFERAGPLCPLLHRYVYVVDGWVALPAITVAEPVDDP